VSHSPSLEGHTHSAATQTLLTALPVLQVLHAVMSGLFILHRVSVHESAHRYFCLSPTTDKRHATLPREPVASPLVSAFYNFYLMLHRPCDTTMRVPRIVSAISHMRGDAKPCVQPRHVTSACIQAASRVCIIIHVAARTKLSDLWHLVLVLRLVLLAFAMGIVHSALLALVRLLLRLELAVARRLEKS
jgi:hypothetical protein